MAPAPNHEQGYVSGKIISVGALWKYVDDPTALAKKLERVDAAVKTAIIAMIGKARRVQIMRWPQKGCAMKLYGVVGAGGFGREVMPLAVAWLTISDGVDHDSELVFVVEDQFLISQKEVNGHRVVSMTDFLSAPVSERRYNIAIGNSLIRERIANSIPSNTAKPFSILAPSHVSLQGNVIGEGAIFCSFSHVTSNARIGRFFHGNIYSYVAHDCVIGDFVTFAPGVMCNGHVIVEDHAYIGTGVVFKDGTDNPIIIGRGAVVGMGAVVTRSVAPGATVIGNPARVMAG